MPLGVMHHLVVPLETSPAGPAQSPLRPQLTRAALIVAVLGVLPFVLDAPVVWQVLGTLVSLAMVAHCVPLVWRGVFSTNPRHLALD